MNMAAHFVFEVLHVAFVLCLYFLTLASYLAPILLTKCWKSNIRSSNAINRAIQYKTYCKIISLFNCASVGIFLATCFLGILPNVKNLFSITFEKANYSIQFPITECTIVTGFLITLLVEQSCLIVQEKVKVQHKSKEQNQGLLEECEMNDLYEDDPAQEHSSSISIQYEEEATLSTDSFSSFTINSVYRNHIFTCEKRFGLFTLTFAIMLHLFFQGITLGLQTSTSKAVHLFVTIIIHACLISSALGVICTNLKLQFRLYLVFALFFFIITPFGVFIGISSQTFSSFSCEIMYAILQGITAGMFLHAIFQDFLPAEFSYPQDRIIKVFFIVLGFITISFVTYFFDK